MNQEKDLNRLFTYHPLTDEQAGRYKLICDAAKAYAQVVLDLSRESSERTQAVNAIQESLMWVHAAITRNE